LDKGYKHAHPAVLASVNPAPLAAMILKSSINIVGDVVGAVFLNPILSKFVAAKDVHAEMGMFILAHEVVI
jgi:hypothetical protein